MEELRELSQKITVLAIQSLNTDVQVSGMLMCVSAVLDSKLDGNDRPLESLAEFMQALAANQIAELTRRYEEV